MKNPSLAGCIIGTAVGDALGLPYEGVSRQRLPRLLGPPDRHRLVLGKGMVSDDTEHTCMVAQSLVAAGDDLGEFTRQFARRLRWWLLALPAGIGKATLRAALKLWFGVKPTSSGVFSAGNGPAMRAAIFGACFDDEERIVRYVRASTKITHTDPKAEFGAIAVAVAALLARRNENVLPDAYLQTISRLIGHEGEELLSLLREACRSVNDAESTTTFAEHLGLSRGVSGYTYHTVPVVIHAWLSHQRDYRKAVTAVIECGGDADTTAAIVGGIVGAAVGIEGIPARWIETICEWPRTVPWMQRLSEQLDQSLISASPIKPIGVNPIAVLLRNALFLLVVLFHGFRRLFPPY